MAHDTVLTIFVIVAAVALAGQAALMFGLYLSLRNVPRQIEDIRRDIKQRIDPITQSASEILANSRESIRTITANLAEISNILRERTGRVDILLADVLERTRAQIIRADQLFTNLTQKVETTADKVERSVTAPLQEISAVVAGVRTGLDFFFSGKRRKPAANQVTHDEELFI